MEWTQGVGILDKWELDFQSQFMGLMKNLTDQITWAERQSVRKPSFDFFAWMDQWDWVREFEDPFLQFFEKITLPIVLQSQRESLIDLGFGMKKAAIFKDEAWRPGMETPPIAVVMATDWIRNEGSNLVVEVTDSTRQSINTTIQETVWTGKDPRKVFHEIKGKIGLHQRWARAVDNYARRVSETHSPEEARRLTAAYHEKLLLARAKMIARTEIIRARNVGQMQAWNITEQQGLLDKRFTRRRWMANIRSDRTCAICKALAISSRKNPIPFGGSYTIRIPVNLTIKMPPAHPNCRCSQGLAFEFPNKKPTPLTQTSSAGLFNATIGPAAQMATGTVNPMDFRRGLWSLFE
jgi:hypothetical protein